MAKNKNVTPKGGAIFKILEAIIGIIAFVAIVGPIAISSFAIASEAVSYSFWPFIGVILAGVLALVVVIITIVGSRKSNHKTVRTRTIIVCVLTFCLTCGLAVVFDIALPDVLAKLASNTIRYEEVQADPMTQAQANGNLVREYVRYNMLNGNYYEKDSEPAPYEYSAIVEKLSNMADDEKGSIGYYKALAQEGEADSETTPIGYKIDKIIQGYKDAEAAGKEGIMSSFSIFTGDRSYDYELYQFVYNWYVMQDYKFSLSVTDAGGEIVPQIRQAVAVAITEELKDKHAELCAQGIEGNKKMKALFTDNFAQFDREKYVLLDANTMISYATSGRMTVPVIVRLLLNESYVPGLYKFQIWDADAGEYKSVAMNWTVLDMNGVTEPITIEVGSLSDLVAGLGFAGLEPQLLDILAGQADNLNELLNVQLKWLVGTLTGTADDMKTAGTLTVVPEYTDDGNLTIVVMSENVERGNLGYMQMGWNNSAGALFAVVSVCASRYFLFVFGAIAVALVYAAGLCGEYAARAKAKKGEAAEEDKAEDEGIDLTEEAPVEEAEVVAEEEPVVVAE